MVTKAVNLPNDFGKYKTVVLWAVAEVVEILVLVAQMITGQLMSGAGSGTGT